MAAAVYYVASVLFPAVETYMPEAILSDEPESASSRPSDVEDDKKSIREEIKEAGEVFPSEHEGRV